MKYQIAFVTAHPQFVKMADQILRSKLRCTEQTRLAIRAVAKAGH